MMWGRLTSKMPSLQQKPGHIAQWIRLCLPSYHPGFEAQAYHLRFYQFLLVSCGRDENKRKRDWDWPIKKPDIWYIHAHNTVGISPSVSVNLSIMLLGVTSHDQMPLRQCFVAGCFGVFKKFAFLRHLLWWWWSVLQLLLQRLFAERNIVK